ncbi:MAG TPA: hypothetical protein VFD71_16265 [Planctomycetota bacterium]|nr:hypothetical protein [Planctomycetota bacterium]
MHRALVTLCLVFGLSACEKPNSGAKVEPGAPPTGSSAGASSTKSATDATQQTASEAGGELKKAVDSASESAKAVTASANEKAPDAAAAAKDLGGLSGVETPSFSLDKLKELVANMTPESLKPVADKLLAAIQGKSELVNSLGEKLKAVAANPAAIPDLKSQLQSATDALAGLKDKLKVVVDKMKQGGVDVSKYTAFLGG